MKIFNKADWKFIALGKNTRREYGISVAGFAAVCARFV